MPPIVVPKPSNIQALKTVLSDLLGIAVKTEPITNNEITSALTRAGVGAGWGLAYDEAAKQIHGPYEIPENNARSRDRAMITGAIAGATKMKLPMKMMAPMIPVTLTHMSDAGQLGDPKKSGLMNIMKGMSSMGETLGNVSGDPEGTMKTVAKAIVDNPTVQRKTKEFAEERLVPIANEAKNEFVKTINNPEVQDKVLAQVRPLGEKALDLAKTEGTAQVDKLRSDLLQTYKPELDRFLKRDLPAGLVGGASGYAMGNLIGGAISDKLWPDSPYLLYSERYKRDKNRERMKMALGLLLAHVGGIGAPLLANKYLPVPNGDKK